MFNYSFKVFILIGQWHGGKRWVSVQPCCAQLPAAVNQLASDFREKFMIRLKWAHFYLSITSHRNWVAKGKWNIYGPVAPRVYPSKYEHGWVGPLGFVVGHKRRRSVTKMWTRCAAMVGIWIKIVLLGMIVSLVKCTKLKRNLMTNANAAFGQVGSLPTRLMKSTVLSLHSGSMKVASWFLPEWIILHDVM